MKRATQFLSGAFLLCMILGMCQPVLAQNSTSSRVVFSGQRVRNIFVEGFVLSDKARFIKLFKSYKNKYLNAGDIDILLQELAKMYQQAGYQGLVNIEYHLKKADLFFRVSLINEIP
ncbi:MAG: hypothetical protein HQL13_07145 [Candidatus Omnitrophica bacterium]|nr:hypothetical protein [Candidatus Omnitrophota bacterium]